MRNLIIILLSSLLLISCKPILMITYGIKNPKVENEKTITKKALKYELDTSNIVTVSSEHFLKTIIGMGIPEGAIYDRDGRYIEYRQTDTSCNAGLFQFIPALNLEDTYNQPDSLNLQGELDKFRDLKGNVLKQPEAADFYVLIYWTVWTGRLNKDHVKIWEDLAYNNKQCKIEVIKVNLDWQEYWDEQERKNIIRAMYGKK